MLAYLLQDDDAKQIILFATAESAMNYRDRTCPKGRVMACEIEEDAYRVLVERASEHCATRPGDLIFERVQ